MKIFKTAIAIATSALFALLLAGCDPVQDIEREQAAEAEAQIQVAAVETQCRDEVAVVVFHEYVPTDKEYTEHTYGSCAIDLHYTLWIPTTIIECCGMRHRYEDQTIYEQYQMGQMIRATVTDTIDGGGAVVGCDFSLK